MKRLTTTEIHTALFFLWVILALSWIVFAPLLGMAFDSGRQSLRVYMFVAAVWSYPVAVILAAVLRRKAPRIAFLPFVSVVSALVLWKLI